MGPVAGLHPFSRRNHAIFPPRLLQCARMASVAQPLTTFIVRVFRDPAGRNRAVIERVSSGAKLLVDGTDPIGPAIAQMLTSDDAALLSQPGAVDSTFPKQEPKS